MNPFDLRGPEFLLFYFCFCIVVVIAMRVLQWRAESGDTPKIDLGDPYLIAYLRGGENEALRVAVISLIDRGLLVMDFATLRRADYIPKETELRPLEYKMLKMFKDPGAATSVFKDAGLKSELDHYGEKLQRAGLIPDSDVRGARRRRLLIALLALGAVGGAKVYIGLSLGRPVSLLIVVMVIAMVIAAVSSFSRLTALGKATLEDIKNLYSGLRTQVHSFSPGSATAELAIFAAVFGVTALAATPFGYARTLFPQAASSGDSSCGSSCSSSDSSSSSSCGSSDGGSSCGGGGCGGCGSS